MEGMMHDEGDIYEVFQEKSKPFDDVIANLEERGLGEDFLLSLAMGSVGNKYQNMMKHLENAFKLAGKFKGLGNVPAYLRYPWAKTKGFRKTGVTKGKATQNDPLFKVMEEFDSKGKKIPPSRMIDFLLDE